MSNCIQRVYQLPSYVIEWVLTLQLSKYIDQQYCIFVSCFLTVMDSSASATVDPMIQTQMIIHTEMIASALYSDDV